MRHVMESAARSGVAGVLAALVAMTLTTAGDSASLGGSASVAIKGEQPLCVPHLTLTVASGWSWAGESSRPACAEFLWIPTIDAPGAAA